MIMLRVTLDDGNGFVTIINATKEEALIYYGIGEILNMGVAHDDMRKIVKVEVLSGD